MFISMGFDNVFTSALFFHNIVNSVMFVPGNNKRSIKKYAYTLLKQHSIKSYFVFIPFFFGKMMAWHWYYRLGAVTVHQQSFFHQSKRSEYSFFFIFKKVERKPYGNLSILSDFWISVPVYSVTSSYMFYFHIEKTWIIYYSLYFRCFYSIDCCV